MNSMTDYSMGGQRRGNYSHANQGKKKRKGKIQFKIDNFPFLLKINHRREHNKIISTTYNFVY